MRPLITYQIPQHEKKSLTREVAQGLIDQADEDLCCATGCQSHNLYESLNVTCYLLHQSLEKWIKAALQMSSGSFKKCHELRILIKPFCTVESNDNTPDIKTNNPDLRPVLRILDEAPVLLDGDYPDDVRYREKISDEYDLKKHARIMFKAVHRARQIIICWLSIRSTE